MLIRRFRTIVIMVLLVSMTTLSMPAGIVQAATEPAEKLNKQNTIPATGNREFKAVPKAVGEDKLADDSKLKAETKKLTAEEQKALKKIFGVAPVTSKTVALCGGTTITYYDKDGNVVGTFHKTTGMQYDIPGTYYDKDGKEIGAIGNPEIKPPVRPADTETDIKVWTQYYKDYVAYINSLDDVAMKKQAWEKLGNDILKLSKEHPELISAGAINAVMSAMTAELKKIYRDDSYKLNLSSAQKSIVNAALNLVKSDAFKAMDDATQLIISHSFMTLGIELTWLSANNKTNSALYPRIAEFYKTLLENGSVTVKAQAFSQLMQMWRIGRWGSKEGNRDVVDQMLKQALDIEGGIQGLVNKWLSGLNDESLDADVRGQLAHALAQAVWHYESLNEASSTKLSGADLTKISEQLTGFLKGVNDGSIGVSAAMRNGLLHSIGSAVIILMNHDKGATDSTRALANAFITMAHDSLLLSADKGGSIGLQSSVINVLTSVMGAANGHKLDNLADKCKKALLDKNFDVAGFVEKGRTDMNTTANADYAAWLARALANLETINLANDTGKVDARMVQDTIADIKAWISVPDHLKDMRVRNWQKKLYDSVSALLKKVYEKGSTLGDDKTLQDNIVAIFGTVSGLKDSLVKAKATEDMKSLVKTLKANGFKDLAYKIEMSVCTTSEALMKKAWDYYNAKDYGAAKAFAQECIDRYGEEALKQQASLKDFAPKGKESKYWALNDVGTAYFILGEIYTKQKNYEKAREAYKTVINKFGYAQCWDPKGWYWKVADAAKKALKELP